MTIVEKRIGEFACNCTDLIATGDGCLLLLLVCGDQEKYVSRIVKLSSKCEVLGSVFTIDTWLLSIFLDEDSNRIFCSTAGGRIIEIADQEYEIVASELPFISGFRRAGSDGIYAFGWHGCVLKYDLEWIRLKNPDKRRIFDLALHQDQIFVCGEAGLFSRLSDGFFDSLDLPTNARLRSMLSVANRLYITSEAPQMICFEDGTAVFHDLDQAPGLDIKIYNENLYLAFGYSGLFRWKHNKASIFSNCSEFRLLPSNGGLLVMGDSGITEIEEDKKVEVDLESQYLEMLKAYKYFPS